MLTHFEFVALSYGVVGIGIAGLAFYIWANLRRQLRHLAELEKQGLSRRRPAREATAR
ncbi:hypothetical protein MNBD_ALPHA04-570 [hydrothermal vent metagenome]|uniref:Heme exporter protein D n=1 Tax=hydrothermal vent metagenome TaxID=652676 RepID=A0A3B0SGH2_9ZZZZ